VRLAVHRDRKRRPQPERRRALTGSAGPDHDLVAPVVANAASLPRLDRARAAGVLGALQGSAGNLAVQSLLAVQPRVVDKPASHGLLVRGAHGASVEDLQTRLNTDGADPTLDVDGAFGPLTQAAVREFQGRHGLAVDGKVGIRTWGILDELTRHSIVGPTATMDAVRPVSQDQHDDIEKILHPGGTGPSNVIPPMTGTGPGGAYETEMVAALNDLAQDVLSRVPATAGTTMGHADRIGQAAQQAAEDFFGASITLASRPPTGGWHPGSSKQGLADASTRPVDQGDILGWAEYFMDNGSYPPAAVGLAHHFDNSRARPDRAEHDRVRDVWLNSGGRSKVTNMIRSWPAEAGTGTVFIQLRQYHDRIGMWELFGTLLHEFQHLVTHPNYGRTADAIGGEGRAILIEGMAEHMRFQVWNSVLSTLAVNATLRQTVEGPYFQPTADAADYAAGGLADRGASDGVYDERAQADDIATRVGEPNARAAFFMGHVEALGIGQGSKSEQPLSGLASWRPGGNGEPDVYLVGAAGETVGDVRRRTGSTHLEDSGGTVWVDPAHTFSPGQRLRVPGIRWHTAIAEDTRGQVANQNGIAQEQLEQANGLAHAPATAPVPAGTLLLIPVN
jgi:peptidoglycan hydrolase-like protein with peptidoglycan-binding domain